MFRRTQLTTSERFAQLQMFAQEAHLFHAAFVSALAAHGASQYHMELALQAADTDSVLLIAPAPCECKCVHVGQSES